MLYITTLLLAARLVAGELDEELHAKFLTMPRHEFIQYFNQQNYSWTITNYGDGVIMRHGAEFNRQNHHDLPVQIHDIDTIKGLPENFDSRKKWPRCDSIKEIYVQGKCESCWTFGTANTASDRTCIHKNLQVRLSEQDFECLQRGVCYGGDPANAFKFWQETGLVTKECKPYDVAKLHDNDCLTECVKPEINYAEDKHFAEKIYKVSGTIDNIKAELFNNGPIQALFIMYSDLYDYNGGVYSHKYGKFSGRHSVRIIGYGVENNEQYWLVANSWGTMWGEEGLFRVKALTKALDFESFLFTGIPKS